MCFVEKVFKQDQGSVMILHQEENMENIVMVKVHKRKSVNLDPVLKVIQWNLSTDFYLLSNVPFYFEHVPRKCPSSQSSPYFAFISNTVNFKHLPISSISQSGVSPNVEHLPIWCNPLSWASAYLEHLPISINSLFRASPDIEHLPISSISQNRASPSLEYLPISSISLSRASPNLEQFPRALFGALWFGINFFTLIIFFQENMIVNLTMTECAIGSWTVFGKWLHLC